MAMGEGVVPVTVKFAGVNLGVLAVGVVLGVLVEWMAGLVWPVARVAGLGDPLVRPGVAMARA